MTAPISGMTSGPTSASISARTSAPESRARRRNLPGPRRFPFADFPILLRRARTRSEVPTSMMRQRGKVPARSGGPEGTFRETPPPEEFRFDFDRFRMESARIRTDPYSWRAGVQLRAGSGSCPRMPGLRGPGPLPSLPRGEDSSSRWLLSKSHGTAGHGMVRRATARVDVYDDFVIFCAAEVDSSQPVEQFQFALRASRFFEFLVEGPPAAILVHHGDKRPVREEPPRCLSQIAYPERSVLRYAHGSARFAAEDGPTTMCGRRGHLCWRSSAKLGLSGSGSGKSAERKQLFLQTVHVHLATTPESVWNGHSFGELKQRGCGFRQRRKRSAISEQRKRVPPLWVSSVALASSPDSSGCPGTPRHAGSDIGPSM